MLSEKNIQHKFVKYCEFTVYNIYLLYISEYLNQANEILIKNDILLIYIYAAQFKITVEVLVQCYVFFMTYLLITQLLRIRTFEQYGNVTTNTTLF